MDNRWYSNLPKAEQEEFKKLVLGNRKVLDRVKEICYNTIQSGVLPSAEEYDSPSWAYKQADRNGYLRAYKEIMNLATLDKR